MKRYDRIRHAIKEGANPNYIQCRYENGDVEYHEALNEAIGNNDRVLVKILLDGGADLNINVIERGEDTRDTSPLCLSCTDYCDDDITSLLLRYGADPNLEDDRHTYPLSLATGYYQLEKTKILLDAGANVNARSSEAIKIAIRQDREDMVLLLLKYGSDVPNIGTSSLVIGKLLEKYRKHTFSMSMSDIDIILT